MCDLQSISHHSSDYQGWRSIATHLGIFSLTPLEMSTHSFYPALSNGNRIEIMGRVIKAIASSSLREIGMPNSNSGRHCYTHFRTNSYEVGMNPYLQPPETSLIEAQFWIEIQTTWICVNLIRHWIQIIYM